MGNLTESAAAWPDSVPQNETDTIWVGGPDGAANAQAKALANRTSWLKANAMRTEVAAGTADAITADFTPSIAALSQGMKLRIRAGAANATTTPTFTPDAEEIAAKTIVKSNGVALVAGDIAGTGYWAELQYDGTLDKWVLLNPATGMATVTATNDAGYADNSVKPASTSWIRGAVGAIATAAGFAYSYTTNGYIKFPSWFAGLVVQWGVGTPNAAGNLQGSLPLSFPTTHLVGVVSTNGESNPALVCTVYSLTQIAYDFRVRTLGGAASTQPLTWIAIGR